MVGTGTVRIGRVWQAWLGKSSFGSERIGEEWFGRLGVFSRVLAGTGSDGHGLAGVVRPEEARRVRVYRVMAP